MQRGTINLKKREKTVGCQNEKIRLVNVRDYKLSFMQRIPLNSFSSYFT